MKQANLTNLSIEQLVKRFAAIGVEQDKAVDDAAKYNSLFEQMDTVVEELKSRDGDQRKALIDLYNHNSMQVRLMAAKVTLAVAPKNARDVLEYIASSGWFPQAGDAGMSLVNLDRGNIKPT